MRKFSLRSLVVGGLVVVLFGFLYGSIFAGIPFQDPTPEMSADYEFHFSVANIILVTGCVGLLLGMVCAVTKFVLRKLGRMHGSHK